MAPSALLPPIVRASEIIVKRSEENELSETIYDAGNTDSYGV